MYIDQSHQTSKILGHAFLNCFSVHVIVTKVWFLFYFLCQEITSYQTIIFTLDMLEQVIEYNYENETHNDTNISWMKCTTWEVYSTCAWCMLVCSISCCHRILPQTTWTTHAFHWLVLWPQGNYIDTILILYMMYDCPLRHWTLPERVSWVCSTCFLKGEIFNFMVFCKWVSYIYIIHDIYIMICMHVKCNSCFTPYSSFICTSFIHCWALSVHCGCFWKPKPFLICLDPLWNVETVGHFLQFRPC